MGKIIGLIVDTAETVMAEAIETETVETVDAEEQEEKPAPKPSTRKKPTTSK